MPISDILAPGRVILDLAAPGKTRVLQLIAQRAAADLGLDAAALLSTLERREALGSTGIGRGVAIPHTSLQDIASPYALLARLSRGVDFDAIDDHPVDIVVLLLTPDDPQLHLRVLSLLSRQLRADGVLAAIRKARSAEAVCAAMDG